MFSVLRTSSTKNENLAIIHHLHAGGELEVDMGLFLKAEKKMWKKEY